MPDQIAGFEQTACTARRLVRVWQCDVNVIAYVTVLNSWMPVGAILVPDHLHGSLFCNGGMQGKQCAGQRVEIRVNFVLCGRNKPGPTVNFNLLNDAVL